MGTYVMETGDAEWLERDRLRALEVATDPSTFRLLTELGVDQGWRCLEVGAGAGSVALWLAARTGDTGTVLATDVDTRYLDGLERRGIEVRRHNILTDPVAGWVYDLIHARTVVEHLANPQRAIQQLVSCLAPGGYLLVEVVDLCAETVTSIARLASCTTAERCIEIFLNAAAQAMSTVGANPFYASRLSDTVTEAGLTDVRTRHHEGTIPGGPGNCYALSLQRLGRFLVEAGILSDKDHDMAATHFSDSSLRFPVPPIVAVWATKVRDDGSEAAGAS